MVHAPLGHSTRNAYETAKSDLNVQQPPPHPAQNTTRQAGPASRIVTGRSRKILRFGDQAGLSGVGSIGFGSKPQHMIACREVILDYSLLKSPLKNAQHVTYKGNIGIVILDLCI